MLHKLLLYNVHARILKLGYLEKGFVVFGKIVFTAINQLETGQKNLCDCPRLPNKTMETLTVPNPNVA